MTADIVRRFRVPIAEINYVRMVVEAYDGLAVVVSPEGPRSGLLEWRVGPGREAEAEELARRLLHEAGLTPVDEAGR